MAVGSRLGDHLAMAAGTILWHDYETSGLSPSGDRPLQFAAVRTDEDLAEVGDPVVVRARLAPDKLPEPEACLVTGVVPGDFAEHEVSELQLARAVRRAMSSPATCSAGYNSIRFDDEFTRFLFWRCLLPVYDREWQDGNTRWDLIDALRAAHALRPVGIEWPRREDGHPSFALGELARANGIDAGAAHDALADVRTTIALARLLRARQPRLFAWLYSMRTKREVTAFLERGLREGAPCVHTSGRFGADVACTSVVVPLAHRADVSSQVIVVDLRHDPAVLLDHDPEDLRRILYTRREDLPADAPRVGIKTVHTNRAPVLAPMGVLVDGVWDRIRLDRAEVERRLAWVLEHRERLEPVARHLCTFDGEGDPDPDAALYGAFVPDRDQRVCARLHEQPPARWRAFERELQDERLVELLFRLRCREAPETLDAEERSRWREHLEYRLATPIDAAVSRMDAVRAAIARLRGERRDERSAGILDRVERLVAERARLLTDWR